MSEIIKQEQLIQDRERKLFWYSVLGNFEDEFVDDIYTLYINDDNEFKKLGTYRIDISGIYGARSFFLDYDFESDTLQINHVYCANDYEDEYNFYKSDVNKILTEDASLDFETAKVFFKENKLKILFR